MKGKRIFVFAPKKSYKK
ncbi:hypothetical protein PFFCH_04193 [Plasmodium falciparum FCH/4]|uniref:Uncharacterized protein n=1 Tax=Plasmodium falciparum FCH/4 TaxID=1036724 RepID=A0A024VJA2_PLAFA|nr:hypothetical protein PFFCH_04193 [Plasmodium falciparum FCH/4]